ncbi:unnamed protein product (macronuclear) [Paramecium tetraurelia]|uniref:Uncharacterized protein n=1 Tax=Paramecium tetraurelia TaxID=5888 RepID=A0CKW2_PARTE|nr:uncharacterized protein GSPATT00007976001 [Paramecium tetraurelia]CAK71429.1 unnamed protein product [Paramecium tetraurelia]|eukprot:XP_001438826.1 hypothetical protein (macronuclear) [Paramecium tetraurelia strain d4-2]
MYQNLYQNFMPTPQGQYYPQYYPQYYYPAQNPYFQQYQIMQAGPTLAIKTKGDPIKQEEKTLETLPKKSVPFIDFEKTSEQIQTPSVQIQSDEKGSNLKPNLLVDSTNIQKNFSKAIVQYALRQKKTVFQILGEEKGNQFLLFMSELVNQLRNLFHLVKYTQDEEYLKVIRILGNNFLRKESTCYIYNSKIRQKTSHIKHKAIVKKVLLKL